MKLEVDRNLFIRWHKQADGNYIGNDEDGNKYRYITEDKMMYCFLSPSFNFYGQDLDPAIALLKAKREKLKWERIFSKEID